MGKSCIFGVITPHASTQNGVWMKPDGSIMKRFDDPSLMASERIRSPLRSCLVIIASDLALPRVLSSSLTWVCSASRSLEMQFQARMGIFYYH